MSPSFPGFVERPNPPVTPETEEWWEATRHRRLMLQKCLSCAAVQLYPRVICTSCGALDPELVEARGTGVVYSHTTVRKSPRPDHFTAPYSVALVRLDEGPTLLSNLVGAGWESAQCDSRVRVVWEALEDGRHLPLFTRIQDDGEGPPWTSP